MDKSNSITPVVKWVGGKRQILSEITKYVPETFSVYYEPFVGGGALLFELQPQRAVVNDINCELMNIYVVIKENVEGLIADLQRHKNEEDYFYRIRELDRNREFYSMLTPVQRASRIIYLNKTCYNGLFRVNKSGEFNAPFGNYRKPNIVNETALRAVSAYFNSAQIGFACQDFEDALQGAEKGAFVYLDPPYDPLSATASFTGYDRGGFGREEQARLKNSCDKLNKKGISFLLSNSATDYIMDLYRDYKIEVIRARRSVNSKGERRGDVAELLVMNY